MLLWVDTLIVTLDVRADTARLLLHSVLHVKQTTIRLLWLSALAFVAPESLLSLLG